ncbi:MAG: c-type cytochrome biogenesis protein CcsB [Burkholderiaceae bacterium]|nr:c-type cytochrome biogenesis protein CcsB [Roseateles sp.]MBV8468377.1 c-type cytochrome biogenesis protein CcsB [Burkholderiaceae bacterium]
MTVIVLDSSRRTEGVAHVAAYGLAATVVAALSPLTLQAWDLFILGLVLAALCWASYRWIALSRAVLAAGALAAVSCWTQGWGMQMLSHTLASSQAQLLGMCLATWTASLASLPAWFRGRAGRLATRATWLALVLGLSGLALRWIESYSIGDGGMGHVPISNLYEVFALFIIIVNAMQLGVQRDVAMQGVAAFTSWVGSAAAGFMVWYALARGGHEIQPLVPALDSYWMKLHVPANFIGYGAFCLAAMTAVAWLAAGTAFAQNRLPDRSVLEETTYRLIATGFAFFTIATILGALWAAEAWGGYWSWDPKETWALVVWLNYAAWLHLRLVKGHRGTLMAWWALVGLLVTLFAFLGVNVYLSGLHSYGTL